MPGWDPAGLAAVNPADPQSWNRYAYVENQPLVSTDPLGLAGNCGNPCIVHGTPPPWALLDPALWDFVFNQPMQLQLPSPQHGGGGGASTPTNPAPPAVPTPQTPPNNGTPGSQVSSACQAQLLSMLNAEHGTNLTDANVTGTYNNGTAANLLISATGLTAAQFNSFQPGRYTNYGGQWLLGFGMAGHIANEPGVNPGAVFNSSNIGGNLSVSFAFHDDHGYANNPFGALLHFFMDVLGHNSRKPC